MHTKIQSALRAVLARASQQVGPFLLHIDEATDNAFRNFAVPDDGAAPTPAQVRELVEAFRARERTPRLEYVAPAPAVDEALRAAGFTLEADLPLMTVSAEQVQDSAVPEGLSLIEARTVEEFAEVATVQNVAYGEPEPTRADIDRLMSTVERGGMVVLARQDGQAAGAGLFAPPAGGLSEIAAVGVLPEFRRRGIASAVGLALTRAALAAGATPFLQTETENENRLYGKLGYRTVGSVVAMSLPAGT